MSTRPAARLALAHEQPVRTIPGHCWTEAPCSYAYDVELLALDVADALLHSCPYNKPCLLGEAHVGALPFGGTTCSLSLSYPGTGVPIFYRPCAVTVSLPGYGRLDACAAQPQWTLRDAAASVGVRHVFVLPEVKRAAAAPATLSLTLQQVTWTSRRSAVAAVGIEASSAPGRLLVQAHTGVSDDGRCVVRCVAIPALVYLLHELRLLAALPADLVVIAAQTVCAAYTSSCVVGLRQPAFFTAPEWTLFCSAVLHPGTVCALHALPARLRGTVYESLAVGAGMAVLFDATAACLCKRVAVAGPRADLSQSIAALAEHAQAMGEVRAPQGPWLDACLSLAAAAARLADEYLALVLQIASGRVAVRGAASPVTLNGPRAVPAVAKPAAPTAATPWLDTMFARRHRLVWQLPCHVRADGSWLPIAAAAACPSPAQVYHPVPFVQWGDGELQPVWGVGAHSAAGACALTARLFAAWHACGVQERVRCPPASVACMNVRTGELVFGAALPAGVRLPHSLSEPWSLWCFAGAAGQPLPGSPVWIYHGDQAMPFAWDHRVYPLAGGGLARAAHALETVVMHHGHPLAPYHLPYPWMYVVVGQGLLGEAAVFDGALATWDRDDTLASYVEADMLAVLQRAFQVPACWAVHAVDGVVQYLDVLTGRCSVDHPRKHVPWSLPAQLATLGFTVTVAAIGAVALRSAHSGALHTIPCLPYSLPDGITDKLRFYPVDAETGAVPSMLTAEEAAALTAPAVDAQLQRCNIAGDAVPGAAGRVWSLQPGLVSVRQHIEPAPPTLAQELAARLGPRVLVLLMFDVRLSLSLREGWERVAQPRAAAAGLQHAPKLCLPDTPAGFAAAWAAALDAVLDTLEGETPWQPAVLAGVLHGLGADPYILQLLCEWHWNVDHPGDRVRVTPASSCTAASRPKCQVCTKGKMALRRKDALRPAVFAYPTRKHAELCAVHARDMGGMVAHLPVASVKCAQCVRPYLAAHGLPGAKQASACSRHQSAGMVAMLPTCCICAAAAVFAGTEQAYCHQHLLCAGPHYKLVPLCSSCTQVAPATHGDMKSGPVTHCAPCAVDEDALVPRLCVARACGQLATAGVADARRQWCREHAPAGSEVDACVCTAPGCDAVGTLGRTSAVLFCSRHVPGGCRVFSYCFCTLRVFSAAEMDCFLVVPTIGLAVARTVWHMAVECVAPILWPFVAVSDATGRVVQIVDERVQPVCSASIIQRHFRACAVPYCCLPAVNADTSATLLLCRVHASAASHVFVHEAL